MFYFKVAKYTVYGQLTFGSITRVETPLDLGHLGDCIIGYIKGSVSWALFATRESWVLKQKDLMETHRV